MVERNPLYDFGDEGEGEAPTFNERWGSLPVEAPRFNLTPNVALVESTPKPLKQGTDSVTGRPDLKFVPVDDPWANTPKPIKRLLGVGGEERYQLWPERALRSGLSAPLDALTGKMQVNDPETGMPTDEAIRRSQDVASVGGPGGLMNLEEKGVLGSHGGNLVQPTPKVAAPFYSAVEHAVSNIKQDKMPADQWLGTLTNSKGVKPEELDWTGLKDHLSSKGKELVTKQEVQDYVNANKVELKEVGKGATGDKVAVTPNGEHFELSELENPVVKRTLDKVGYSIQNRTPTKFSDPKYQLPGGPLSRDTELLTKQGWRRIDTIWVGDEVLTRKDEDGNLEWQMVEYIPTIYSKTLYHFYNSSSIDLQVSACHQMVVRKRRRSNLDLYRITAKEAWKTSELLVPLTGKWEGEEINELYGLDAGDVAELIGWYIAEGWAVKSKNGIKSTLAIGQSRKVNSKKCNRLEALFLRLNIKWNYVTSGGAYYLSLKSMPRDLINLLHEQGNAEDKFIPRELFDYDYVILSRLLESLLLGDGCLTVSNGRQPRWNFFSKSKQLADDVQLLVLLNGRQANVRQRSSGLYVVGINNKEWCSLDDSKYTEVEYNDIAYCVTVKNHCIYVRRNGVAGFTGNSNYKEMLMTLPEKKNNPMGNYQSSHWDEPNVLAHVRTNDRNITAPGETTPKKSLHVEEIQSDLHQEGRDRGYGTPAKDEFEKIKAELLQKHNVDSLIPLRGTANKSPELKADLDRLNAAYEKSQIELHKTMPVPDFPFKKTWHELALKRMIREAAEKGYDRLSWTPGEAQAARYSLEKQVDKIATKKNANGNYDVEIWPKGAGTSFKEEKNAKQLSDFVGKEMADKIIQKHETMGNSGVQWEGEGLKVGGEGMKGFYDKMIPNAIEKIGKEHGVKVKQGTTENGDKVYYIDIPESLKNQSLSKGFPLFSSGGHFLNPIPGNPHEQVDNSHHVPYGAGASNTPTGFPVNVDKRIPKYDDKLKLPNGQPADLHKYLTIHEIEEYKAMKAGIPYHKAHHDIATPMEKKAVESDGVSWKEYEHIMDGYLKETEEGGYKNLPPRLYTKPYPHSRSLKMDHGEDNGKD